MNAAVQKMLWATLVLGLAMTVRADDDEDETDEEENRAVGVTLKTVFPDSVDSPQVTTGVAAKALVHFENEADTTYQVEFINAHLASALQPDHIMQNLTGMLVNRTVNQGESVSMLYKFTPFKDLDPREYNLVLQVYFMSEEDNDRMSLPAFNETITVHDGASFFDAQSLFLFLIVAGIAGFVYYQYTAGTKKSASARKVISTTSTPAPAEVGTVAGNIDLSYVSGQHIKATRNRSQDRSKSPKGKKN